MFECNFCGHIGRYQKCTNCGMHIVIEKKEEEQFIYEDDLGDYNLEDYEIE